LSVVNQLYLCSFATNTSTSCDGL